MNTKRFKFIYLLKLLIKLTNKIEILIFYKIVVQDIHVSYKMESNSINHVSFNSDLDIFNHKLIENINKDIRIEKSSIILQYVPEFFVGSLLNKCILNTRKYPQLNKIIEDTLVDTCVNKDKILNTSLEQYGFTSLFLAVSNTATTSSEETVLMLIKNGARINYQNVEGETVLHLLVQTYYSTSSQNTLQILLDNMIDINMQTINGSTVLHTAIDYYKKQKIKDNVLFVQLMEKLINNGANPNISRLNGITPLHLLTMIENYETMYKIIELFVKTGRAKINQRNALGWDAFGYFVISCLIKSDNHISTSIERKTIEKIIKFFVKFGADLNYPLIELSKTTLLHTAILYHHTNLFILENLVKYDALNINICNQHNETPLHFAVMKNSLPIVELLLRRKDINLDIHNKLGDTPLQTAIKYRSAERDTTPIINALTNYKK